MRRILLIASLVPLFLTCIPARAQNQSKFAAEFSDEWDRFTHVCAEENAGSALHTFGCRVVTAFTDHPLHISAGSIAPQNGFGFGPAFVYGTNFQNGWRVRWSLDGVRSTNGSWRAGLYFKGYPSPSDPSIATQPIYSGYVQAISLSQIDFFGLGNFTSTKGRSFFGMREIIPGASILYPIFQKSKLHLALYGEANGRLVQLRGRSGQSSPSIEQLYTVAEAPGLTHQPGFFQIGEGIRFGPSIPKTPVKLTYHATFQQFFAPSDSAFSFRRLTLDFSHRILLPYSHAIPHPNETVGPNGDPKTDSHDKTEKAYSFSRDVEGSFELRFFLSESIAPAGHVVPFYFQPTMGGSDLNGDRALSSYQDYRFRAPNVMFARAAFEHSLWKLPLGFTAMADYGKVALTRGDLDFDHLRHSFSAGFTVRGENIPQLWILFAWGGHEGTHTIGYVNPNLLGGTPRPSLF